MKLYEYIKNFFFFFDKNASKRPFNFDMCGWVRRGSHQTKFYSARSVKGCHQQRYPFILFSCNLWSFSRVSVLPAEEVRVYGQVVIKFLT